MGENHVVVSRILIKGVTKLGSLNLRNNSDEMGTPIHRIFKLNY